MTSVSSDVRAVHKRSHRVLLGRCLLGRTFGKQENRDGNREQNSKGEEYYHYHLAGVVVHMGTANSGHYYSFIRPREGTGDWLEFNDTVVSAFDVKVRLFFVVLCFLPAHEQCRELYRTILNDS